MGDIRSNKCPCCNGTNLIFETLCQYGLQQKVLKNGKLSKTLKKVDYGSMEAYYISCKDCGWNSPDAECGTNEESYLLMREEWYDNDEE